jgi:hypothetical protein
LVGRWSKTMCQRIILMYLDRVAEGFEIGLLGKALMLNMSMAYKSCVISVLFTRSNYMKNLQEIQKELIDRAISWGEAFSNGDYRNANKQNSRIVKIARKFQDDKAYSETVLIPLLAHSNPSVRLMASVYALEFGINTREAESILTTIAEDPNLRLIPMMARINLSNWKKRKEVN